MLSIMPKIPVISVGIQMERTVSVSFDRNIRDTSGGVDHLDLEVVHIELNSAVLTHEDNSINKLTETIKTFTTPFSSDHNTNTDLYNLVTRVVMNDKTNKDLVNQSEEGRKLFSAFVQDRIKKERSTSGLL